MRRVALLITLLLVFAVAFATPAGAVNLTGGCEGSAVSLSEDGDELMVGRTRLLVDLAPA